MNFILWIISHFGIESIEHDILKTLMIQIENQIVTKLSQ